MKKHKFTCVFITVLTGILLAVGSALAAWNVSEYAINLLSMTSYKNSIEENYNQPDHVDPGQKVVKEVYIKNEGSVDSFIRVKIRRTFGTSSDTGEFAEDPQLDPEMIEIHYNTDFWKLEEDGYWYYKDVLLAGKSTQKPLMDSYYLSEKADNRYKNKEARIIVNLESIQAEASEMKTVWGKDEKELGITYQPCTCETVTSVIFDQDHRLTIGGESTDLFANFKNLQPGCSRSQTIRISNTSDITIQLYLRAEAAEQEEKNLELIQQLLTKYGVIEIRENEKVIYQGTVDGNLSGSGWSLKKDIALGSFQPGLGRNLVVKLSLDENMSNEYEDLLAKVKWVFSAKGKDPDPDKKNDGAGSDGSSGNVRENGSGESSVADHEGDLYVTAYTIPKTGDETKLFSKWIALFAALFAIFLTGRKLYRKEKSL